MVQRGPRGPEEPSAVASRRPFVVSERALLAALHELRHRAPGPSAPHCAATHEIALLRPAPARLPAYSPDARRVSRTSRHQGRSPAGRYGVSSSSRKKAPKAHNPPASPPHGEVTAGVAGDSDLGAGRAEPASRDRRPLPKWTRWPDPLCQRHVVVTMRRPGGPPMRLRSAAGPRMLVEPLHPI